MNYPHWFGFLITETWDRIPYAAMYISAAQAGCAVHRYIDSKEGLWAATSRPTKYDSLVDLLRAEGLAREDLVILTDDPRGKCIAFRYCDDPSGRCDVEYFDCGDCNV